MPVFICGMKCVCAPVFAFGFYSQVPKCLLGNLQPSTYSVYMCRSRGTRMQLIHTFLSIVSSCFQVRAAQRITTPVSFHGIFTLKKGVAAYLVIMVVFTLCICCCIISSSTLFDRNPLWTSTAKGLFQLIHSELYMKPTKRP